MKRKRYATFTPGPWAVERHDQDDGSINYEVWNHSQDHYTRIVTVSDRHDDSNARNNARLIAEAPMLVFALDDLELRRNHYHQTIKEFGWDHKYSVRALEDLALAGERARAALAKARGALPVAAT